MSNRKDDQVNKEYTEDVTIMYFNHIMNLALSRFKYENLPKGLTTRIIEYQLINNGLVMFFEENGIYKCLRANGTGQLNIYGEPTSFYLTGVGYAKTRAVSDGIIIANNPIWQGDIGMISYFADRLNEVEQTKNVNLAVNNVPFLIKTSKKGEFTWRNIWKQIRERKIVLFTSGDKLGTDTLEVLQTGAEMLQEEFQNTKNDVLNEVLTYLGINNNPTEKKERLLVDEVNSNNQYVERNIELMFEERERAVKEINEKYGLNIKVSMRGLDDKPEEVKKEVEE